MTRHVLVTGAAGGIGRATVEHLESVGVNVIGVDLHDATICCDLSDPNARDTLMNTIQSTIPRLDAVVAAAGVLHSDPATVVAVNFFGATRMLESLRPLLAQSQSPRALVLSSTSSRYPCDECVIEACLNDDEALALRLAKESIKNSYAATKAALARWTRRRAVTSEWGGNGILLNAMAPGMIVDTGMTRPLLDKPGGAERLQELTPTALGRFGTPDDMARLIAFLVGADNRYIAGQVIYADGGCDALQRGDSVW
jgi:NAD(P)-dependent dehydrogenase (short-subunit alcohol dehydrogenase family)